MDNGESGESPLERLFAEFVKATLKTLSVDDVLAYFTVALVNLGLEKDEALKEKIGELVLGLVQERIKRFHPASHGDGVIVALKNVADELKRAMRHQK